jgi:hypothetical protein
MQPGGADVATQRADNHILDAFPRRSVGGGSTSKDRTPRNVSVTVSFSAVPRCTATVPRMNTPS